jgi:ubiquinone/menaquinone biosynthesis C-methylase UbiE
MDAASEALLTKTDKALQQEFNQWAAEGRGEEMEDHHSDITEQTIAFMDLKPGHRILDLGCGTGWASRRLAKLVPQGSVTGIDVADEMLRRAEQASAGIPNIRYALGSAENIPAPDNSLDKVLSVESFYYYSDQGRALDEIRRVLAPEGGIFILINFYKDNPYSLRWQSQLKVPVQALSEGEYLELLHRHALRHVQARRIPDRTPSPDEYAGKWFRNAAELKEFKRIGALLLMGTK